MSTAVASEKSVDACVAAVQQACGDRGVLIEALDVTADKRLQVTLKGTSQSWELAIECDSTSVAGLPHVRLHPTGRLHPHVGYRGTVCVSDHQGISLDPERGADIVAYTLLAAFDLLEKWDFDRAAGMTEFYNELEGYWSGLPGATGTSGAIEVDCKDRLITFYLKAKDNKRKWYFTERDAEPPRQFDVKGAASQAAVYVHLDAIIPPPTNPEKLSARFVAAIRDMMSPNQRELWTKLVRPSSNKNHPKRAVLLVSVPRASGGVSLIGIEFGTRNGDIDLEAAVTPLTMRRLTASYMRERGGASAAMYSKHVVVVGCGAVGSVIADTLAASGVGRLTLVDHDLYSEDNVFRHILDPFWVDTDKVYGLKFQLETHYPGIKVDAYPIPGQKWLRGANLDDVDGVILALGLPTLEQSFCSALRKGKRRVPILFTWLEPLDLGGHSVLVWTHGEGCLACLYRDEEGAPSLQSRIAFLAPNQAVSKNLTGCGSVFVPYGALQSRRTGLMATEHILSALAEGTGPSYRFWAGEGKAAAEQHLRTTPWWDEARTAISGDSQSRRAFGRPCKNCRDAK